MLMMRNLQKISKFLLFRRFEAKPLRAFSAEAKKTNEKPGTFQQIKSKTRSDTAIMNNFIYRTGVFRKKPPEPQVLENFKKDLAKFEDFSLITNLFFVYSRGNMYDESLIIEHFNVLKRIKAEILTFSLETQIKFLRSISFMKNSLSKPVFEEINSFSKEIFLAVLSQEKILEKIQRLDMLKVKDFLVLFNYFTVLHDEIASNLLKLLKNMLLKAGSGESFSITIFTLTKFFNTIEYSHTLKDSNQLTKKVLKEILSDVEIIEKLKSVVLGNLGNSVQIMSLTYVYSRLGIEDNKLWQLLIDYFELNYKKFDNDKFKRYLSALLMGQKKTLNRFFMIEIKSDFDTRLQKMYENKEVNNDFFVRGLRSFVSSFTSVITNEDHALELYENYIRANFNSFTTQELIGLNYVFAIIVYKNEEILSLIFNRVLETFAKNSQNIEDTYSGLFFWSNAVLKTDNKEFWALYQRILQQQDFEKMNNINLVRNVLPLYFLLNFRRNLILPNNSLLLQERFEDIMEKSNERVFSNNVPTSLNIEGFNFFHMCKAFGYKFFTEVIVEIYPADFYIEGFFNEDFEKKMQELDQIEENYYKNTQIPLDSYRIKKTAKEIQNYVSSTKENSLVIEINGILHYNKDQYFEKGNSLQKNEILQEKGYHILVLNYNNCDNILKIKTLKERLRFMLELFKTMQEKKTFVQENPLKN